MVVILWRFYFIMPKKHFHHIPLFSTRATATVSVALVLVILGIAAMVGVATHRLSQSVRDNMGFVVIFNEDVTADDIAGVTEHLKSTGAVSRTEYSSPDDILARWQKMVGEDEDILRLANVNPFTAELEVIVNPEYASADSIGGLVAPLALMPQVGDVKIHSDLIDNVNATLRSVSLTLVAIAIALLVVSFVLIFNTVRLSVYSQRFIINRTYKHHAACRGHLGIHTPSVPVGKCGQRGGGRSHSLTDSNSHAVLMPHTRRHDSLDSGLGHSRIGDGSNGDYRTVDMSYRGIVCMQPVSVAQL